MERVHRSGLTDRGVQEPTAGKGEWEGDLDGSVSRLLFETPGASSTHLPHPGGTLWGTPSQGGHKEDPSNLESSQDAPVPINVQGVVTGF